MRSRIGALLFDLDGTMVDSDPLHLKAFNTAFAVFGRQVDLAYYNAHIVGCPNDQIMATVFPDHSAEDHQAMIAHKESVYGANLSGLIPIAGLVELLQWAQQRALPCAVVSSGPRTIVTAALAELDILGWFDCLVVGDEVAHLKPHPLPYLTALEKLGIEASEALVFEDSLSGVRAACAAGIPTIGMLTTLNEASLIDGGAVHAIRDFYDAALWRRLADSV